MDAIVSYFEKLVTEFSWRRIGLLFAIVALALVGLWAYEAFTGQFRASRMEFASNQLQRLSDPSLMQNVKDDPVLKQSHESLKADLNRYVAASQYDLSLPEPVLKVVAAAIPWILLGLLFTYMERTRNAKTMLVGTTVVSTPFLLVGGILPFISPLINYFVYPFFSTGIVVAIMMIRGNNESDSHITTAEPDGPALSAALSETDPEMPSASSVEEGNRRHSE